MDASRLLMPGLPCDLCGDKIPEGSGVLANRGKKTVKFCSACLRGMMQAHSGVEPIDTIEVRGVFYTPGDTPLPPPIERIPGARRPNIVYDVPQTDEPKAQEPLKYRPVIPPRRP